MENNKLNGFNNGRDITDGIGGHESLKENMKWCAENMETKEVKTLRYKVFEALGEVSMCWSETPKGIFDSTNAERIGNKLIKEIEQEVEIYKKIAYEGVKSQTGKFLLMDINYLPEGNDFDINKFLELAKQQKISLINTNKPTLEEAIEVLCNALREDTSEGSYYDKLRQDLSKSLFNDMTRFKVNIKGLPCISVQMAENFLNLLIKK